MKLNINAKELLALHNLLYERFGTDQIMGYDEGDPRASADVQLNQVYNRLKACIVGALTNKAVDPFDAWQSKEQAKIDKLTEDLDEVRKAPADLARSLTPEDLSDEDREFVPTEYPRRGPRPNRPGNGARGKR